MIRIWITFTIFSIASCVSGSLQREKPLRRIYFENRETRAPRDDAHSANNFLKSKTFLERDKLGRNHQEYSCFVFSEWGKIIENGIRFCDNWQWAGLWSRRKEYNEGVNIDILTFKNYRRYLADNIFINIDSNNNCKRYNIINGKKPMILFLKNPLRNAILHLSL